MAGAQMRVRDMMGSEICKTSEFWYSNSWIRYIVEAQRLSQASTSCEISFSFDPLDARFTATSVWSRIADHEPHTIPSPVPCIAGAGTRTTPLGSRADGSYP